MTERGRKVGAGGPRAAHFSILEQIDKRIIAAVDGLVFTGSVVSMTGGGVRITDDNASKADDLPTARTFGSRFQAGDRVWGLTLPGGERVIGGRMGMSTGAAEQTVGEPDLVTNSASRRVIADRAVGSLQIEANSIDGTHINANKTIPGAALAVDYATDQRVTNVSQRAEQGITDAGKAQGDANEARRRADNAQTRADAAFKKGQDGVDDARDAQNTADDAKADANAADNNADQAKADAAAARARADEAYKLANQALTIANRAMKRASQ